MAEPILIQKNSGLELAIAESDFGAAHLFEVPLKSGDVFNGPAFVFHPDYPERVLAKIHQGNSQRITIGHKLHARASVLAQTGLIVQKL